MKQFKEQEYTVNVCTNIDEWVKEFFDIPDGAVLANKNEVEAMCHGFAELSNKEIWIYIPKNFDKNKIGETIAHEIGHIIENKFPTNPEDIEENHELHEKKAEYYENFYGTVRTILARTLMCVGV